MSPESVPRYDDAVIEDLVWAVVARSQNSRDYLDFLSQFPFSHRYRDLAMAGAVKHHRFDTAPESVYPQVLLAIQEATSGATDDRQRRDLSFHLAKMYHKGFGTQVNPTAAVAAYEQAIALGETRSLINLGSLYEDGDLGAPDLTLARQCFEKSVSIGEPMGFARLAMMLGDSQGEEKFDLFMQASERGSGFSMMQIGFSYLRGWWGQSVNLELGLSWLARAARAGYGLACYHLGWHYRYSKKVPQDLALAREWFSQGAAQCDAMCQRGLGILGLESLQDGDDATEALLHIRRAAVQEDLIAMHVLGSQLLHQPERFPDKPEKDAQAEGLAWLHAAFDLGDQEAAVTLYRAYWYGIGTEKDPVKGSHYCLIAAKKGHPEAQGQMGLNYWHGEGVEKDFDQAYAWLSMCALQGRGRGLYLLGRATEEGIGCQPDPKEAFRLYQRAAALGEPGVDYEIGQGYFYGVGVEKDPAAAVVYFRKAAQAGDERAMTQLGCILYDGDYVLTNYEEAAYWFEQAARKDHPKGMYLLGLLHDRGDGVEQSDDLARKWISRAAMAGDPKAQAWLQKQFPEKPDWLVKMLHNTKESKESNESND